MNSKQRAELERLAELAYERQLGHYLSILHGRFDDWRRGSITARELSDLIHEYHQGPARDVWAQQGRFAAPQRVAWGIADGHLEEREVDPAILDLIRGSIDAFRESLRD